MVRTLALVLALLTTTSRGDVPKAPDGKRGFGHPETISEMQDVLYSKDEDSRDFVTRLFSLRSEYRIRRMLVRQLYERLGYFDLLAPSAEPELGALHDVFFEGLDEALTRFEEDGVYDETRSRMWADVSFALRAELLEEGAADLEDLNDGLLLLLAHRDGYVDLQNNEAGRIAKRVDLAAARLRSTLLDLDSLSRHESWTKPAEELSKELLAACGLEDSEARTKEYLRLENQLRERMEGARTILFTTRLAETTKAAVGARNWNRNEAQVYLDDLLPYVPGTDEAKDAPKEIRDMAAQDRYGQILKLATAGTSYDPLSEDLNFYAAVASDFLYGELDALRWYDRYLAIRGLRAFNTSTTRGRVLTKKERAALDVVQRLERANSNR